MKRIRRIIFNAMTVLSLVLCVATVGMWGMSHWIRFHSELTTPWHYYGVISIENGEFEWVLLTEISPFHHCEIFV